jgi:hypothetical protein
MLVAAPGPGPSAPPQDGSSSSGSDEETAERGSGSGRKVQRRSKGRPRCTSDASTTSAAMSGGAQLATVTGALAKSEEPPGEAGTLY